MKANSFLSLLANHILANHSFEMESLTIVLPNKRARVFLLEELKQTIQSNSFAPRIISIEDFIQEIASIRTIDS
ncbi:hypothetical protein, partial [Flavobacterium sp.]|uniref:hypothetical protein n=1 Tax=Flavobacterium sp. TaxID=239 RepID=UPI0025C2A602